MQPDGRFIQNIKHSHQLGAHLGRQADALSLPAREGDGGTFEGEVIKPYIHHEAQTGADFTQNAIGNHALTLVKRGFLFIHQMAHPLERFVHGPFCDLDDVFTVNRDAQGFFAQALPVAFRAGVEGDESADLGADPLGIRVFVAALQVADHAFEGRVERAAPACASEIIHRDLLAAGSIKHQVKLFFCEAADRIIHAESGIFRQGFEHLPGIAAAFFGRPVRHADRAFSQAFAFIRDQEVGVDFFHRSQSLADRAGAVGRVERECSGFDLNKQRAVFRAGKAL